MSGVQNNLVAAIAGNTEAGIQLAPAITGSLPGERLVQIYRHNFISRFSDALQATFPKTQQFLGTECFQGVGQAFFQQVAFSEASLLGFGNEFADFLAQQEVIQPFPFCIDLARLEWAMEVAYNQLDQSHIVATGLAIRAGLQVISSGYALLDMWHFDGSQELDINAPSQWVLVYRDNYEVMLSSVGEEQGVFIQALLMADVEVKNEVLMTLSAEQILTLQNIGVLIHGGQ